MSDTFLPVYDYCLCFLDLLGFGDAVKKYARVPHLKDDSDRAEFQSHISSTAGQIKILQDRAEDIVQDSIKYLERRIAEKSSSMANEEMALFQEYCASQVRKRQWSDGLVYFAPMNDLKHKCPINSVFEIFGTAGVLYFEGLAMGQPMRGGIDLAWGIELQPGEIYGSVVAHAYDLESKVAQYPRIVVHDRVVSLLQGSEAGLVGTGGYAAQNSKMAKVCLSFLARDTDGNWIIDVLGDAFLSKFKSSDFPEMFKAAKSYVITQLQTCREARNTKLALRYSHLLAYFEGRPPG